jgi:hypothetical protein
MKAGEAVIYIMRKEGWKETWEMHISKTPESMRDHIKAMYRKWKIKDPRDYGDAIGLVHPVLSTGSIFAYCFLNEGHLGAGVVSHECLHVAMAHERFVLRFGMNYGDSIGDDEERLAYYLTSCVRGAYDTLYDNDHIKTPK